MSKKIKVFDMFCSNGSTWFDKDFFNSDNVIKNDIRSGDIQIMNQTITIKPDFQIDVFTAKMVVYKDFADLVYLDPPHLTSKVTGIMVKKYTKLPENAIESLTQMFENASIIAPIAILKWNDSSIPIKDVLKLAEKYFVIGFGNRNGKSTNQSYFITLIRKERR